MDAGTGTCVVKQNPLMDSPPPEILELIERGAMFFVNHSGGKDISTTTTM